LRRTKLDELPQLWNVFRGDMGLVGPRPEVTRYVQKDAPDQRQALCFKPGVSDLASLICQKQESLLRDIRDLDKVYVAQVLPSKIPLNLIYAPTASIWKDTKVILRTVWPGVPLVLRAAAVDKSFSQRSTTGLNDK